MVLRYLLVIGGGYVGVEAMRRLGSKVTVIGRSHRLLRHEDENVTETLHSLLEDEGIELALNARLKQVSGRSDC